ncbi:hypothetical protein [Hymenobacter sp. AT01-02]|uniref:hypothetical protein n=1 Tax=Hymenobacter sp. AT01-02 TaxID=1571877 RepID=UPI00092F1DC0|nr:hypothetical protein [Hymenobacter sp. AT01-02]
MKATPSPQQLKHEKQLAAEAALRWVRSGMLLGLGSGSTAALFISQLGAAVRAGQYQIQAVATSLASEALAAKPGFRW